MFFFCFLLDDNSKPAKKREASLVAIAQSIGTIIYGLFNFKGEWGTRGNLFLKILFANIHICRENKQMNKCLNKYLSMVSEDSSVAGGLNGVGGASDFRWASTHIKPPSVVVCSRLRRRDDSMNIHGHRFFPVSTRLNLQNKQEKN